MANKKGLFGILNDGAGAGLGITRADPDVTLGSAITHTIATPCFVNAAGVLVFPQLSGDGAIPVTLDATGVCFDNASEIVGSTSFQTVATITGALLKRYKDFELVSASMTECDWELVYTDDAGGTPVETVKARWDTGPGQYSFCCMLKCIDVDTTAGTGVQNFKIRGKLLEATGSNISATLAFHEV